MAAKLELHPIQLKTLRVQQLEIELFDVNRSLESDLDAPFTFQVGNSNLDTERSLISVGMRGFVGRSVDDAREEGAAVQHGDFPFLMRVHILGLFEVDLQQFKAEHVPRWAEMNAPLILFPYLREHIYGLASRAGLKEVILPLFILPTFSSKI